MKKIFCLILLFAMLVTGTSAMAETSDISRFADYTDVDLDVFINKGYSCSYDDFDFSAELAPADDTILLDSFYDSTIQMDIKVLYSAGSCALIPRLIFYTGGITISEVYIRNGGNRYIIDVSDCSRYDDTVVSVKPIHKGGKIMLEDLALYPQTIDVKMGVLREYTLTDADQELISQFYNDCLEAGIFDQEFMSNTDDYSIRTLFNENTVVATENEVVEETTSDGEQ